MFKRQGILHATASLGSAKILHEVLAFCQFTYFIYAYGSSRITDAIIIAQSIPFLLSSLFNRGFIHTFIPIFTDYKEKMGEKAAWQLASAIAFWSFLILTFCAAIFCLAAPTTVKILAPGFNDKTQKLCVNLLRFLSLFIIFDGMSGILRCLYFTYRTFTVPALATLFISPLTILSIFFLKDTIGIYAVAIGIVCGAFLQIMFLISMLNTGEKRLRFTLTLWHKEVKKFVNLIGPRFVSMTIARVNIIVDHMFASGLGQAFISSLKYAHGICNAPLALINASFGAVIIPVLSQDAAESNIKEFHAKIQRYILITTFMVVPILAVFIVMGEHVVEIIFKRGAFQNQGVSLTITALFFYSFGILAVVVSSILRGSFFALQDTVTPLKVGVLTLFLNVILNAVLIRLFSLGGLALSTSIVQWISLSLLFVLIQKKIGFFSLSRNLFALSRVLFAGSVMAILMLCGYLFLVSGNIGSSDLGKIFAILSATMLGFLGYLGTCKILHVNEVELIFSLFRKLGARIKLSKINTHKVRKEASNGGP